MKQTTKSGSLIAATAVAMVLAGSIPTTSMAAGTGDTVHCAGINSCKGKSDCKTAENACKGQNTCKGHGFLATTAAECSAKGGKVIDSK